MLWKIKTERKTPAICANTRSEILTSFTERTILSRYIAVAVAVVIVSLLFLCQFPSCILQYILSSCALFSLPWNLFQIMIIVRCVCRTGVTSSPSPSSFCVLGRCHFLFCFFVHFMFVYFFPCEMALFWSINWAKSNSIGIGSVNHFEWYGLDILFSTLLELISVWLTTANAATSNPYPMCIVGPSIVIIMSFQCVWNPSERNDIFESHKWNNVKTWTHRRHHNEITLCSAYNFVHDLIHFSFNPHHCPHIKRRKRSGGTPCTWLAVGVWPCFLAFAKEKNHNNVIQVSMHGSPGCCSVIVLAMVILAKIATQSPWIRFWISCRLKQTFDELFLQFGVFSIVLNICFS